VDLSLTREQRAVREAFAALFGKQATPERVRRAERGPSMGFDQLLWRHYADVGALGIGVPSDCGGGEGGLLELALVAEEAGGHLAPIPVAETAAAARLLGRLREKELLGPVLRGSVIVSLATLPGPVSQQMLVDGAIADAVLALDGESVVYVTRPDGLPKTARRNLGGLPLAPWYAPGATTVLAEGGEARRAFESAVDEVRVLRAAALVGLASAAVGIGSRYAIVREAFGQPIGMYQAVAHPFADALTALDGPSYWSGRLVGQWIPPRTTPPRWRRWRSCSPPKRPITRRRTACMSTADTGSWRSTTSSSITAGPRRGRPRSPTHDASC
jgi:Acyl-CoA dehydrogenase, N-terminal domain/Acyl-CoA dehydrogenase, C-terminal domain